MEKALHHYFGVLTDGKIHLYSKDDVDFLITSANSYIEGQSNYILKKDPEVQSALDLFGDKVVEINAFIYACMEEYFLNGFSDTLLNSLNPKLQMIRNLLLTETVNGKLVPVYVADLPMDPPPTVFAAHMFANIAFLGGLDKLERCESQDCQKFYTGGRPNRRWCSDACGSRNRVREKRSKSKS